VTSQNGKTRRYLIAYFPFEVKLSCRHSRTPALKNSPRADLVLPSADGWNF
jgi:hypothetical protein